MCVYILTHLSYAFFPPTYVYMYTDVHTNTHAYSIFIVTAVNISFAARACTHAHTRTHPHRYTHAHTRTHPHRYTHAHTRTHHTHAHTRTHAHRYRYGMHIYVSICVYHGCDICSKALTVTRLPFSDALSKTLPCSCTDKPCPLCFSTGV